MGIGLCCWGIVIRLLEIQKSPFHMGQYLPEWIVLPQAHSDLFLINTKSKFLCLFHASSVSKLLILILFLYATESNSRSTTLDSRHHQSLLFSYPSLTSKSPATSLNNFLCSGLKYAFHPPVFPERKVRLFSGWIAFTKMDKAFARCGGIW